MKRIMTVVAAAATTFALMAEGYQINTLSARQEGMGHVGVAMKLGAESMFFNPGGLGFLDKTLQLTGSLTGVMPTASATIGNTKYTTDNGVSTPISLNAAFSVYDNLKAGISLYTPYGSSINWTDNWPGAVLNQSVDLATFTIQPTLSWRITPRLSVGAGLMITWGNVDLNKGLVSAGSMDKMLGIMGAAGMLQAMGIDPAFRFGNTTPASVNLQGTTRIATGINVGAMYDVNDRVTVGVSFRSKMDMTVKAGDASVKYANELAEKILGNDLQLINSANFRAQMPCPYVWNFGVSYRPVDRLILALDAQLTGWSTYKTLDIEFLDALLTPYNQHLEKNYRNSWTFHLGGQYTMTPRLDLRAGVMIDQTPVNKAHYNPETPGMTKIEPSVGFSFRPVSGLSVDVAFMYVAGLGMDNASCSYTDLLAAKMPAIGPAQATFTADYKVHALVPSIGISYSF